MGWRDIRGWSEDDVERMYTMAVENSVTGDTLIEHGVAYGRSLALLGELALAALQKDGKRLRVLGVDPWVDEEVAYGGSDNDVYVRAAGGYLAACTLGMMTHAPEAYRNVRLLKMTGYEASLITPGPVSFVFIDGGTHGYEEVKADIAAWRGKVRVGGILAGHDHTPSFPGVQRAVTEAFGGTYKTEGDCWYVKVTA